MTNKTKISHKTISGKVIGRFDGKSKSKIRILLNEYDMEINIKPEEEYTLGDIVNMDIKVDINKIDKRI